MAHLLFICGRPGTGKTTLAKAYVKKHGFVYLDKDDIAEPLCPNDRESAKYKALHFPIYEALMTIAKNNLSLGNDVLIDSPFNQLMQDEAWWEGIEVLAEKTKAQISVVRTFCHEVENYNRLITRGYARDNDKISDFKDSLEKAPMLFKIIAKHIDIDTEQNLEVQINLIENYLVRNVK